MEYIDIHSHVAPGVDFEKVIEDINANDVSHIGIMPGGGASESQVLEFYEKYPDRVVPFYGDSAIQTLLSQWMNSRISFLN